MRTTAILTAISTLMLFTGVALAQSSASYRLTEQTFNDPIPPQDRTRTTTQTGSHQHGTHAQYTAPTVLGHHGPDKALIGLLGVRLCSPTRRLFL